MRQASAGRALLILCGVFAALLGTAIALSVLWRALGYYPGWN
jgi:hypothetical protein